jgi:putative membrane protein
MFGTRAWFLVDCTFLVTLAAPLVVFVSLALARRRRLDAHRRLQVGLLVVCIAAVLVLELCIRLAGGSGAFLAHSGAQRTGLVRVVLAVHVTCAVATYAAWTWLAVVSHRRFRGSLPGSFSRRHRQVGRLVYRGLCLTAISAAVMYTLAFIV